MGDSCGERASCLRLLLQGMGSTFRLQGGRAPFVKCYTGWWADTSRPVAQLDKRTAGSSYFDADKSKFHKVPYQSDCRPVGECAVKGSVLIRRGGALNEKAVTNLFAQLTFLLLLLARAPILLTPNSAAAAARRPPSAPPPFLGRRPCVPPPPAPSPPPLSRKFPQPKVVYLFSLPPPSSCIISPSSFVHSLRLLQTLRQAT